MFNPEQVKVFPYKAKSEGAEALANELGVFRLKHEGSVWRAKKKSWVINWGSSKRLPENCYNPLVSILNEPEKVAVSVNKVEFFDVIDGSEQPPRIPLWTESERKAKKWLNDGHCVLARQKIEGMGGDGIVIMEKPLDFVEAELYTMYIPKNLEYRVYMSGTTMVDAYQKKRRLDEEPKNWKIRSRENGFIYTNPTDRITLDTLVQCQKAMTATGLDFAGVDVIISQKDNLAYVLEVNTAPWLSERTTKAYAEAFRKKCA